MLPLIEDLKSCHKLWKGAIEQARRYREATTQLEEEVNKALRDAKEGTI
jgi:hypothetical protein